MISQVLSTKPMNQSNAMPEADKMILLIITALVPNNVIQCRPGVVVSVTPRLNKTKFIVCTCNTLGLVPNGGRGAASRDDKNKIDQAK